MSDGRNHSGDSDLTRMTVREMIDMFSEAYKNDIGGDSYSLPIKHDLWSTPDGKEPLILTKKDYSVF